MPDITKISGTVKLNFLVRKEVIISIHKILYSTEIKFIHSFSSKGNPYDNACIESFHAALKKEEVNLVQHSTNSFLYDSSKYSRGVSIFFPAITANPHPGRIDYG